MGADMYLNPPADPLGPRRHVVIDMETSEVWGPYHKAQAVTAQRKIKRQHPDARRGRFVVRKMERY